MKIISKIKIHLFFYIVMAICLFTGNIRDFLVFSSIIIVHEIGHIVGGLYFKWDIEKIIILPFGGLSIFNNKINTSLFEQAIVTIFGPLFQLGFYFLIIHFYNSPCITYYNFLLLIFNLLPIYPLDGSKLLYVFFNLFFPFKFSHLGILFISVFNILFILFLINSFDLVLFLILFFLSVKVIREFFLHEAIFNKFLFERYLYNFSFKKVRRVKKISNMWLWCRHVFFIDNKCITEKNILAKRFDKASKL